MEMMASERTTSLLPKKLVKEPKLSVSKKSKSKLQPKLKRLKVAVMTLTMTSSLRLILELVTSLWL